jgi:Aminotransferase class I and II
MWQSARRRVVAVGAASPRVGRRPPKILGTFSSLTSSTLTSSAHRSSLLLTSLSSRSFASLAEQVQRESSSSSKTKPLLDVRKQLWEFYLSTGRGANALFEAIDLEERGSIEPQELKTFLFEVFETGTKQSKEDDEDPREIMPYAWNRLEQRQAAGQTYDMRDFKKWLVAATKMSADMKNSRMMEYLKQNPNDQYMSDAEEDDVVFTWNDETMSQTLRRMQYAVRGEVVMRADQLASQGREILYTNIGNPHQVGQAPITYYRQVLALCDLPADQGVDHPKVYDLFPKDVVARARDYRDNIIGPSGTGAYTHSQGLLGFRKHVAEYIQNRDGYPAYPGNIFLTNGASNAIAMILQGLLASNNDAVMIPIPQYPIYSGT